MISASLEDKNITVDPKEAIKYRLRHTISIFCAVGGFFIAIIVIFMMTYVIRSYNLQISTQYVRFIAPAVEKALQNGASPEALNQELTALENLETIAYGALINNNGHLLAEWQRASNNTVFNHKKAAGIDLNEATVKDGAVYIKTALDAGKKYYMLLGIDSSTIVKDSFYRSRHFYFPYILGVIGICLLALFLAQTHVGYPLHNLGETASKMLLAGDLTTVLPVEVNTEIGQLTVVINTLTQKMRHTLEALKEACSEFEEVAGELADAGGKVSNGSLVIKEHTDVTAKKMEELTSSFMNITNKLQELNAQSERGSTTVYEMSQVNQEMFDNVSAMSASVTQSIGAIKQMTEAIDETSGYMVQLNNDIGSVNAAMGRLDTSIDMEEKSAKESIALSKELSVNAESGMRALEETIGGIEQIQKSSFETASVVAALGNHAMDIGNILHVIDDVTKQTNLLALNAAIISAQAGEHGRGFAVVADEIGALASRTKDSTKEIAELIATIQDESKEAVAVMQENNATIESGVNLGAQAAEAFARLKNTADKSTAQAENLAKATIEQANDVRAVTGAVSGIISTVEAINTSAHRQADDAAALNTASGKMNLINQQVARSSEEQARSAKEVLKAIKNIAATSGEVNERQVAQIESTKLASSSIVAVDSRAKAQNESSRHLESTLADIKEQIAKLTEYTAQFKI